MPDQQLENAAADTVASGSTPHQVGARPSAPAAVVIRAYREGPLLVRGPVVLEDELAHRIEVRRPVIALCRCGRSRTAPLCDGSHVRRRAADTEGGA